MAHTCSARRPNSAVECCKENRATAHSLGLWTLLNSFLTSLGNSESTLGGWCIGKVGLQSLCYNHPSPLKAEDMDLEGKV